MKALALADFDSTPTIQELPIPEPGPGHVRIRVKAAALNGIDPFIAAVNRNARYYAPDT